MRDPVPVLLLARLSCSDPECPAGAEEAVETLEELDALACECGCTWELLAVSLDATEAPARLRALVATDNAEGAGWPHRRVPRAA